MMKFSGRPFRLVGLTLALTLGMGPSGFGQSIQSTILGSVKDGTGAAVAGATVEVTNQGTSFTRKLTTDENGDYRAPNLEPGRYSVTVVVKGFNRWVRNEVVLDSNQLRRVDADLQVGDINNTVTVTANDTPVATETAALSNVKTSRDFTQLPLSIFGRGVFNVTNVTAAVQSANGQLVVNGARDTANSFTSDGIAADDIVSSRNSPNGFQIDVETLREVKVQTANNSAEFPQVAQFSAISKSGENQPHGSLYWGNFNSVFSTRSFYDSEKPSFTNHNMFAGTLGGPVYIPKLYNGRDKTFFFVSYGGARYRIGNRQYSAVPTAAFRTGDFSAIAGVVTIRDPETGLPFPGNRIPASRINPVSKALQDLVYPDPNRPGEGDFGVDGNFTADPGGQFNADGYSFRVDQKLSKSNTMFVRVGITHHNQDVYPGILKQGRDGGFFGNVPGRGIIVSDTQVFSPTKVNEARMGYHRTFYTGSNQILGEDIVGQIGLQGVSNPKNLDYLKAMPGFGFARFAGTGGAFLYRQAINTYQWTDNFTWLLRKHAIKLGGDLRRYQVNDFNLPDNARGSFFFDDQLSGFDYANFLLGLPSFTSRAIPRPALYPRSTQYGLYVQDDWKINQKLTLNYGIRYEYQSPWIDKFDRRFAFDRKTGSLVVAGDKIPTDLVPQLAATLPIITAKQAGLPTRSLVEPDRNNWSPRLGIAWRPFADATTVIRLGFGWYTQMFPGLLALGYGNGGPWQTNQSFEIVGGKPTMRFPNPFTAAPGIDGVESINVVNPFLPNERAQQWNVSVGREFLGIAIDVAYVGTKTTNIPFTTDLNLPPPGKAPFDPARRPYQRFSSVNLVEAGGQAIYHGLTIQADRKLAHGLWFNANYAFGKALTDVDLRDYAQTAQQNQYNRRLERGPDPNIRKHQLRFSYIYELPVGRGKTFFSGMNRAANVILGGWQVNGITTIISGQLLSPEFSGVDPANTNQFGGRPDLIGNVNIGDMRDRIKSGLPMWDRAAFVVPQDGRGSYGNSGRYVLVGPGRHLWN
ncbi:MAG: TonB-dependent receptor, partial [Verrucomicrobiales bacterium]|nr:TonB-dependent receptor [Verrucomicrobiales bacterium]